MVTTGGWAGGVERKIRIFPLLLVYHQNVGAVNKCGQWLAAGVVGGGEGGGGGGGGLSLVLLSVVKLPSFFIVLLMGRFLHIFLKALEGIVHRDLKGAQNSIESTDILIKMGR